MSKPSEMPHQNQGHPNQVIPIVRYVSGTMSDERFNVHQHVRQVLEQAFQHFTIDKRDLDQYELRLEGAAHALRPEQTLQEAGVMDGTVLLLTTRDQTDVDG